jgi:hypothetical protein
MNINKLLNQKIDQTYIKTAKIPRNASLKDVSKFLDLLPNCFKHLFDHYNWAVTVDGSESHIILSLQCRAKEK